jgi:hypothetical protein
LEHHDWHRPADTERPRHQRIVKSVPDAHGEIDPLIDEVDHALQRNQLDFGLGVEREKIDYSQPWSSAPVRMRCWP